MELNKNGLLSLILIACLAVLVGCTTQGNTNQQPSIPAIDLQPQNTQGGVQAVVQQGSAEGTSQETQTSASSTSAVSIRSGSELIAREPLQGRLEGDGVLEASELIDRKTSARYGENGILEGSPLIRKPDEGITSVESGRSRIVELGYDELPAEYTNERDVYTPYGETACVQKTEYQTYHQYKEVDYCNGGGNCYFSADGSITAVAQNKRCINGKISTYN